MEVVKKQKEKRRNMERRKEKSRDAARCRRSKETEIFTDLSSMLPLFKNDSISHLDKASIIRIAISYLKIRTIAQSIPIASQERDKWVERCDTDSLFQNALEGFLLVMTTDGVIVYISDNVQRYLGLSQVDLLGHSIFELSHPCDEDEIREMLSAKDHNSQKSYFLRMKCTLTDKGRNVNIKSASYKVIRYTGRIIETHDEVYFDNARKESAGNTEDDSSDESSKSDEWQSDTKIKEPRGPSYHFIAVGEHISHPANIEIPLGQNTFLTKHSLDLKFSYADEKISDFFGYNPDDLLENSVFDYHHAEDSIALRDCFKNLFSKGQTQTERYRFLASGGGYAWVLTQATVIYTAAQKPHSVVCVNFVISGVENQHEVYSLCQIEKGREATSGTTTTGTVPSRDDGKLTYSKEKHAHESSPQRLLEKLTINTSAPPPPPPVNQAENTIVIPCDNSANRQNEEVSQTIAPTLPSASVEEFPSPENKKLPQSQRQVQLLSVSDLLVPCSSSSSSSNTKTANSSSCLDDNWLMTTNNEKLPTFKSPDPGKLLEKLIRSKLPERVGVAGKPVSPNVKAPKPATIDVFVPFTEEMNKGFLGFADDEKGLTMLKGDPEDLTHLAPTAGDVCVPLDETPVEYVLPDMLDDIMLSDCNLLSVDKVEGYLTASPNSYFNYEDDLESLSRPLSPMLSQTEDCSIPSLRSDDSPLHSGGDPFLDFEGLMPSSDEINELSSKNSLLPLPLDADPVLPFVTNDFMWGSSSEESAWSSVSSSPTSNYSSSPRLDQNSSLAKLLTANPINSYHGQGTDSSEDRAAQSGGRQRTTETITNKRSACQLDGSVNLNRSYSNNGSFNNNKTTMQYQQRSSTTTSNQVDANRRRCNPSKMTTTTTTTTTTNSMDSLFANPTGNGNLQNVRAVLKRDLNNRGEDKRTKHGGHSADMVVGSKRSSSESWGRSNACKRSKQNGKSTIVNANGPSSGAATKKIQQQHDSARSMAAAVAAAKQTNSVLMNLLVSGCDLNAGYDADKLEQIIFQTDQFTDQDIQLIEEALVNGHSTNGNSFACVRTKKKSPKDLPDFLEFADNDVDSPSSDDSFLNLLDCA